MSVLDDAVMDYQDALLYWGQFQQAVHTAFAQVQDAFTQKMVEELENLRLDERHEAGQLQWEMLESGDRALTVKLLQPGQTWIDGQVRLSLRLSFQPAIPGHSAAIALAAEPAIALTPPEAAPIEPAIPLGARATPAAIPIQVAPENGLANHPDPAPPAVTHTLATVALPDAIANTTAEDNTAIDARGTAAIANHNPTREPTTHPNPGTPESLDPTSVESQPLDPESIASASLAPPDPDPQSVDPKPLDPQPIRSTPNATQATVKVPAITKTHLVELLTQKQTTDPSFIAGVAAPRSALPPFPPLSPTPTNSAPTSAPSPVDPSPAAPQPSRPSPRPASSVNTGLKKLQQDYQARTRLRQAQPPQP